jgi:hypothetical protein
MIKQIRTMSASNAPLGFLLIILSTKAGCSRPFSCIPFVSHVSNSPSLDLELFMHEEGFRLDGGLLRRDETSYPCERRALLIHTV